MPATSAKSGNPSRDRMWNRIVGMDHVDLVVPANGGDSGGQRKAVIRAFEEGEFDRFRFAKLNALIVILKAMRWAFRNNEQRMASIRQFVAQFGRKDTASSD